MSIHHSSAFFSFAVMIVAMSLCFPLPVSAGVGFQPVSPEELKMTSEPQAPGAPAIILYRQVDRDDNGRTSHEDSYYRIKILTEEGRKYADVEIPFAKGGSNVVNIHARTIRPDGSIADFDGKVFEKVIAKARTLKYFAKTFTLPDIQVGCIIEYFYTYDLKEQSLYDSNWILSEELFTKRAKFSLKPYPSTFQNPFNLRWTWQGLPPGTAQPAQGADHLIRLDARDIPAFQTEDFMPPANELKSRVDFIYSLDSPESDPDKFWQKVGKKRNGSLESFIDNRKAMEDAVGQIVSPNDPPEVKLRKIYDRVQTNRNSSYELRKTEQEEKRDKEKPPANVEELWKRGYGNGVQLTWLYLALVRAAGFEAYGCWVSDRRQYFFEPKMMQSGKLDANVVMVKSNGSELYFDPGAAFTPFAMLTWSETGTHGLCLDKDGGKWIRTTFPASSDSQIHREAKLKLSDSGDLEGTLTVKYTGLEAMYRRLELRNADEVERKKFLEDQLKEQVPAAAELELTNKPDWASSESPLVAELNLKIPGWASSAGKKVMLPVGFFAAYEKHVFEHANRVHPIYFEYPYEKMDDVTIELPAGWKVSNVPQPQTQEGHIVAYSLKAETGSGTVHVVRKLNFDVFMLEQKYYSAMRKFFEVVRTGDEEQILLQPGATSANN
jgi:Domain of Unknown Function with PDB structure (DUF3857)